MHIDNYRMLFFYLSLLSLFFNLHMTGKALLSCDRYALHRLRRALFRPKTGRLKWD